MKYSSLHIPVLSILAALLLASCSMDMEEVESFDSPTQTILVLRGRVTDEGGNPLKGIQAAAEFVFADDQKPYRDTLYSNVEGYLVKFYSNVPMIKEVGVTFKDIDGEANGGRFKTRNSTYPIACLKEGDGNFGGSFEVVVEAKLSKAEE